MEKDQHNIIAELRDKFKQVIHLYEAEKSKNEQLESECAGLKNEIQALQTTKAQAEQKYKDLQLAKAFTESAGSSHDAKLKVNKIVREIDKCIALLNR